MRNHCVVWHSLSSAFCGTEICQTALKRNSAGCQQQCRVHDSFCMVCRQNCVCVAASYWDHDLLATLHKHFPHQCYKSCAEALASVGQCGQAAWHNGDRAAAFAAASSLVNGTVQVLMQLQKHAAQQGVTVSVDCSAAGLTMLQHLVLNYNSGCALPNA